MKTNDQKAAEFPMKYAGGDPNKTVDSRRSSSPILGLTDDMGETSIQLRFSGYKDAQHSAAQKAVNETAQRIGKAVAAADQERHAKVLRAGDVRQRTLTEAEKLHQADLRAAKRAHDMRLAAIERHHHTAMTTARLTFEKAAAPLNAEMETAREKITDDMLDRLGAAQAEMTPAMEAAKTKRLALEADRKARAIELAAAAKSDETILAEASDEALAAAAAVEARGDSSPDYAIQEK